MPRSRRPKPTWKSACDGHPSGQRDCLSTVNPELGGRTVIARDALHELFIYDNGVLRNRVQRGRAQVGSPVGTMDAYGYLVATVGGRVYKVHRLIYAMFHGVAPAILDHINGDPADNRIENLRPATTQQNGYNRKINRTSKTGVKGVTRLRSGWMAQCQVTGKRHYLGVFKSPDAAAKALYQFRSDTQKEFARNE